MDVAIDDRLLAAGRDLLAQGLYPYEIEHRVFNALTAPARPMPARRAQLFRAGIGLAEPLPRGEASELADALGRALRGSCDRAFGRRLVLAHVRSRLLQAAHDQAESLRRNDIAVTRENLAIAMMMSITKARRGCELILDNPAIGCSVEAMIEIAVTDYFSAVAGR
jgi:hypothetical protein